MEKALEIEEDMLENQENKIRKIHNCRRPQYQGPSGWNTQFEN